MPTWRAAHEKSREGTPDVAIVGSGPNALSAGVVMARSGLRVRIYEAADELGGGLRSAALFDSDISHDMCSAVHPLTDSAFFREFGLEKRGVALQVPEISYAHPLEHGRAGLAYRDLERTRAALGPDGRQWRRMMRPLARHSRDVVDLLLSDMRPPPLHPKAMALLAQRVLRHGTRLTDGFNGPEAPAMFAGVAAHAGSRLPGPAAASVGLLLGHLAHTYGWPIPAGGSARIAEALIADLRAHGAELHTDYPIRDLRELRRARVIMLDVAPRGLLDMAGSMLPTTYRAALARYRYGTAAAKVDFLVSEPIPWTNPEVGRAGTVHLGGSADRIAAAERAAQRGNRPTDPFVLVSDPAVADPARARDGKRPVWAYCHVPNADPTDPTDLVRARIERFAPGFSDTVLHSRGVSAVRMNRYNPNYVGGDISAGAIDMWQALARPAPRADAYSTPLAGVYLCSAATPPGPGVHGMSGYRAALSALRREFGIARPPSLA